MPDLTLTLPASLLLDVEERGGADWVLSLIVATLDQEMRKCVVCRLPKPLSKYRADHKRCDDCTRRIQASQLVAAAEPAAIEAEGSEKPKREKLPQSDTHKVCSKCGEIKPLEDFNTQRIAVKTGLPQPRGECKTCEQSRKKASAARWYERNRERHIANVTASRQVAGPADFGGWIG